jgi:hypothetical protein
MRWYNLDRGTPMTHISLDQESDLIKQFVRSLPLESEGVALELEGRVICKVVPPIAETDGLAFIERARELVRRARDRNRDVGSREIEREIQAAIDEVRQRKSG